MTKSVAIAVLSFHRLGNVHALDLCKSDPNLYATTPSVGVVVLFVFVVVVVVLDLEFGVAD